MRLNFISSFAWSVVLIVAVLIVLEGIMRLLPLPLSKTVVLEGGFVPEPWGYKLAANAREIREFSTHTYTVLTDGEGVTYTSPLEGSQSTILFLGDSFTQGTEEGMYTREFWELLKKDLVKKAVPKVVSGGVGGYSLWEAYNWFHNYGKKYAADLVVYGFFFNDITGYFNNQSLRISKSQPGVRISDPTIDDITYWNGIFSPHPFDTLKFLRKNSRLLKMVDRTLNPPQPYGLTIRDNWITELTPNLSPIEKSALDRTFDHLRQIKAYQEARGGKLAVLLIPDGSEVVVDIIEPRYFREIKAFCVQEGLHCIDPTLSLRRAYRNGGKVYWNQVDDDDAHFTPMGYSIVAEFLEAAYLKTKGFITLPSKEETKARIVFTEGLNATPWKPKLVFYQFPIVTLEEGTLDIVVSKPPAGVILKLPVKPGVTSFLQLDLTIMEGDVTARFRDGEDLVYLKASSGARDYILSPRLSVPELLLYSDNATHFRINRVRLVSQQKDDTRTREAVLMQPTTHPRPTTLSE
ncbi:MAG: SGNH/GDSL hydrolase family protein [Rhodospirillaceae bacterium]|jgi:hypothetical protein|nr:SGNH/GDSL hydrolase family protein [Rhodospirillaceae bacterium]